MSIDNVADISPRIQYVASAAQTDFDYPFPIFDDTDLVVDVDGVTQAITTDYTVTGEGEDTGGTVTFVTPMTGNEVVTIYRDMAIERLTDFQQNGPYSSASLNDDLDRITLVLQDLKSGQERSLRFSPTSEATAAETQFSPISSWLEKFIYINASGIPEPAAAVATSALTQATIGSTLYPQTAAELAAGVTPTNYYHPPGYLYRYGTNATPGTTNMAAALTSALLVSATHPTIIPMEVQLCNSALTVPAQGLVYGYGKNSVVKKGFSGDLFTMGAQSELRDFYIDGDGSTRTGRGVVISTGSLDEVSWRRLTRMSIINMASYCVEFTTATAGYASMLFGCRMTTTDQVVVAVKMPDTEANNGNRIMVGCWTFGTPLADFGGCDNMTLIGCHGAYPTFGTASKKVSMTGCRIVNNGPGSRTNWTIQGTNHAINDNVVGVTTLTFNTSLFKSTFHNSVASGTTYADTSRGVADGNEIEIPQTSYTPTWTGSSSNPAIGSGTLNGTWRRRGEFLKVNVKMIAAGDTTFGTGYYLFSVPRTASRRSTGSAYLLDNGTAYYAGTAYIEQGESNVRVVPNTGSTFVGTAVPFTWATTDELVLDIEFPIT